MKGLAISSCTVMSGVAWALVIIHGSALAPQVQILSYMMTGVVAFLMCIQARRTLLSFVPGTFIGACATFAADGDWRLVIPSLALGLVFGYAMKIVACGWRPVRISINCSSTTTPDRRDD
ncbi:membrane protein [Klebsiella pneumoniae subsp. pneumoniae]|uniref:Membrane protein n=1 Tax=Klebsiella pneumoniae subsp. pneumoniae TaxID=72407 RepID=A0A378A054_KLEPN|nr:membrane protein [Klebsiella pneumoniae subsp. pneumoniae]